MCFELQRSDIKKEENGLYSGLKYFEEKSVNFDSQTAVMTACVVMITTLNSNIVIPYIGPLAHGIIRTSHSSPAALEGREQHD